MGEGKGRQARQWVSEWGEERTEEGGETQLRHLQRHGIGRAGGVHHSREGELWGCSTERGGNTITGSLHWELSHLQLGLCCRIIFYTQGSFPLQLPLLQPWIICVAVFQTAPSSQTCPMATWQICRGLILPRLLQLLPPQLSLLQLGLQLQPLPLLQKGNPSHLSPAVQDSSVPSPTWWSRQLPQQDWLNRPKSRHLRSSRFSWSLTNHSRSGRFWSSLSCMLSWISSSWFLMR